ncbi:hypothetical protein [Nocardia bovistercoris]|nr:hypothetical protein [Nocardia bovistercoris]
MILENCRRRLDDERQRMTDSIERRAHVGSLSYDLLTATSP